MKWRKLFSQVRGKLKTLPLMIHDGIHCPGQADSLFLASTQSEATLSNLSLVRVWPIVKILLESHSLYDLIEGIFVVSGA
jgi:hypothetical protein